MSNQGFDMQLCRSCVTRFLGAACSAWLFTYGHKVMHHHISHLCAQNVQELRAENARCIARARTRAPEWIDEAGYDLIVVPRGATVRNDGERYRVFTKSDYRKLVTATAAAAPAVQGVPVLHA